MPRRRSNLTLFAGISVLIVALWISFLLGTIYASYFEAGSQMSRSQRQTEPAAADCSCSTGAPNEGGEAEPKDKESEAVAEMVLVDRKVSADSTTPEEEDDVVRMRPESLLNLETISTENISVGHEDYHLTWTRVEKTWTNVFSAYFDDRPAMHGPSIVLPGYQSKKHRNQTLFCMHRNKDGSTEFSPRKSIVMEMDACNEQKEFDKKREREFLHVFHICTLLQSENEEGGVEVPTHVALCPDKECQYPSSFIPVYSHRPKKKIEFGVCVQTPAFGKSAQDFVSFIELYKMMGVQFFTLYVMNIDHSTLLFLRKTYGGKNGILDIVHWTQHLNEKEPIHYYGEILAIHDCLYRNMYRIKYLAFVDLDEAVIPRRYKNWRTMLHEIDHPYVDSFIFPNSIFMKTDADHIDMELLDSWSSKLCEGVQLPVYFTNFNRVKCVFNYFSRSKLIVKPELIVDTDIHGVCTRVGNTTHYLVPEDSAVSQHYRSVPTIECRKNRRTRKYPTRQDDWMIRYADPLLNAVRTKLCK